MAEVMADYVNQLLRDAIIKQASDIHIEPYDTYCRIRFRCDGLLIEIATIPLHFADRVITRLKIMAQMNIAERRLPQDGRMKSEFNKKIDIRVSTCPTLFGEKIVLRLLNNQTIPLAIETLGMTNEQQQLFLEKLQQPQGLILVTGPTGSGKTITLYSALQSLNHAEKNISSVEDPVEIELPGINQINANTKIGLDFATVLRTLLRQDPDIIMVGEIRDLETATIALQAAQTGHLVFSTLHTNSAIETIARLQAMGIEPYQWTSSISLVIAQRLVRKLCAYCRDNSAEGCGECHNGYLGRTGVFELLPITKHILNIEQITQQTKTSNWRTMWDIGIEKVNAGVTSYSELARMVTKN